MFHEDKTVWQSLWDAGYITKSMIGTATFCPYILDLQYNQQIEVPKTIQMLLGSHIHDWVDYLWDNLKSQFHKLSSDRQETLAFMKSFIPKTAPKSRIPTYKNWITLQANRWTVLQDLFDFDTAIGYFFPLTHEERFTNEKLMIAGKPDAIHLIPVKLVNDLHHLKKAQLARLMKRMQASRNPEIMMVLEIKTGRMDQTELRRELHFYKFLLEGDELPDPGVVDKIAAYNPVTNYSFAEWINPQSASATLNWIHKIHKFRETGDFPVAWDEKNDFACSICQYKTVCDKSKYSVPLKTEEE